MKVLLPTDFSENARYAVDFAIQLLEEETTDFYLWHVVKASTYITDDLLAARASSSVFDAITSSSKEALDGWIEDLKAQYNNQKHKFHTLLDYDNFVDAANQVIHQEGIDLIVMGTRGNSNLDKTLFGSNTLRLIQRTSCPVLVIPDKYVFRPIKKVALVSRYDSDGLNENEFSILNAIAKIQEAQIEVVHAMVNPILSKEEQEHQVVLDDMISDTDHKFTNLVGRNQFDVVHNYIEVKNHDLICVTGKKYNFFERLFYLQNVEMEMENLQLPLLALKE